MIQLGLTNADHRALLATLASSHSVFVRISITDLVGNRISEISDRLLTGQIDVDADAAVTRTCLLTLFDPKRSLAFDSNSPEDGALWHDRMIKVQYEVHGPLLVNWVSIPVFHGFITKMSRDDASVSVEAQGKELFGIESSVWVPHTYKKGSVRSAIIKDLGATYMGETKFSLPATSGRTPYDFSLGKETHPWDVAKQLSRTENCDLFYDGRGTMTLRKRTTSNAFTFTTEDGGMVTSSPKVAFSSDNLKNLVWVKGAVPRAGRAPIEAIAVAPNNHPMSPRRLGRNNAQRFLLTTITDDTIRTLAEAHAIANTTLNQALLQGVDVTFDAMVMPLLEEFDVVTVKTDDFSTAFQIKKFSIPLVVGGTMPIGYHRNRPINKVKIR